MRFTTKETVQTCDMRDPLDNVESWLQCALEFATSYNTPERNATNENCDDYLFDFKHETMSRSFGSDYMDWFPVVKTMDRRVIYINTSRENSDWGECVIVSKRGDPSSMMPITDGEAETLDNQSIGTLFTVTSTPVSNQYGSGASMSPELRTVVANVALMHRPTIAQVNVWRDVEIDEGRKYVNNGLSTAMNRDGSICFRPDQNRLPRDAGPDHLEWAPILDLGGLTLFVNVNDLSENCGDFVVCDLEDVWRLECITVMEAWTMDQESIEFFKTIKDVASSASTH